MTRALRLESAVDKKIRTYARKRQAKDKHSTVSLTVTPVSVYAEWRTPPGKGKAGTQEPGL